MSKKPIDPKLQAGLDKACKGLEKLRKSNSSTASSAKQALAKLTNLIKEEEKTRKKFDALVKAAGSSKNIEIRK